MLRRRHRRDLGDLRSRMIAPAIARTVIEELEARRLLTILMTGTSFSALETSSQSQTVATFTDNTPSAAEDYSATINWGDGTTTDTAVPVNSTAGVYDITKSHTYAEDGVYATTVTVRENVNTSAPVDPNGVATGDTATASGTATVSEQSLSITASAVAATEGTQFSGIVATATDPGSQDLPGAFTATIDWGDGTTTAGGITNLAGTYFISGSHTYTDEGSFSALVTFFENSSPDFKISVTDAVTVAEGDSATPTPATISTLEHTQFSGLIGTFTDPSNPTQVAGDWSASITWGDGTTSTGTVSGNTGGPFTVSGTHTWADEGSFGVTATVTDDAPGTLHFPIMTTATVAENDSFTPHGMSISPDETQPFSGAVATFDDSDAVTTASDLTATIDWGDGTTTAGTVAGGTGSFTVSGGHTYAEDGAYTTKVVLSDDAPGTASATAAGTASVQEFQFALVAVQSFSLPEGQPFSGTVASFNDPGSPDPASDYSATVDWGDGTTTAGTIAGSAGNFTVSSAHTWADEGSFHVHITVSEPEASFTIGPVVTTATVTEADTLAGTALAPVFVTTEGSTLAGALATFTDTGYPDNVASDFTATIDFGDGTTTAGIVTGGSGTFTVSPGTHTFLEEGAYNATITLSDDAPGTATASVKTIIIVNDAPLTPTGVTVSAIENSTLSGVVGRFTDADPNGELGDYIANIDWGDGTATAGLIQSDGAGGFQVVGKHKYGEEGNHDILISVHDAATATAIHSLAKILDPAVVAKGVGTVSGIEAAKVASNKVLATFTDPGGAESLSDYTATIDWGDGTHTSGKITFDSSKKLFSVASVGHTYTEQGNYSINVTVAHESAPKAHAFSTAKIADAPLSGVSKTFNAKNNVTFNGVVGSFIDDDKLNTKASDYKGTIDWGDCTKSSATFVFNNSTKHWDIFGSHKYTKTGDFTVKLDIDDLGGSSVKFNSKAHVT